MVDTLAGFLKIARAEVDDALNRYLPAPPTCPEIVSEAMRYSVFAGGKRLRPILALAGFPGRIAMRGRHVAELSHALARVVRAGLGVSARRLQQLERQLAGLDVSRQLATMRTRLVAADGRLTSAATRRQDRAAGQLRAVAGRLDVLSPLAVLGRGYAVAWNADKTRVLRDAAGLAPDDHIRVTLSRGEIEAKVTKTS